MPRLPVFESDREKASGHFPFIDPPHFHAEYGDKSALIDMKNLAVFAGSLPPRAQGLVVEWAILHRAELLANWEKAKAQQELQKIAPLE